MTPYNGFKCWAHWNVSLWLANDWGLYRMALDAKRGGAACAPRRLLRALHDINLHYTPDGARYTLTALRVALAGL